MEYQDQEITCSDCGDSFPFTVAEQQFYAEKGLDHPPKRCKPCRMARKAQAGGRRGGFAGPPRHDSAQDAYQAGFQAGLQRGYEQQAGYQPGGYQRGGFQRGGFQRGGQDRPRGFRGGRQGPHRNEQPQDGPPLFKDDFRSRPWHGDPGPRRSGRPGSGNERGGFRGGRPGARGGQRAPVQLHDAVCSDCSSETQVPFKPNGVQPVFCRTCLPKHKPRRARYGNE